MLRPSDVHPSRLLLAVDLDAPAENGESAVLRGVGRKLVQQQREFGDDIPGNFDVTSRNRETAGYFLLMEA
jgi:hypothetical protein